MATSNLSLSSLYSTTTPYDPFSSGRAIKPVSITSRPGQSVVESITLFQRQPESRMTYPV